MIFRKPVKSPIETAIAMLGHAITIVYGYKHDSHHTPTEYELKMIDTFTEELWENYCAARHIQRSLHERVEDHRVN